MNASTILFRNFKICLLTRPNVLSVTSQMYKDQLILITNPWFDNTCKEKRDEFHRVRDRYRFDKSDRTKEELNLKANAFRRQMHISFKIIHML
jgi:hypothetical protein